MFLFQSLSDAMFALTDPKVIRGRIVTEGDRTYPVTTKAGFDKIVNQLDESDLDNKDQIVASLRDQIKDYQLAPDLAGLVKIFNQISVPADLDMNGYSFVPCNNKQNTEVSIPHGSITHEKIGDLHRITSTESALPTVIDGVRAQVITPIQGVALFQQITAADLCATSEEFTRRYEELPKIKAARKHEAEISEALGNLLGVIGFTPDSDDSDE
ncbi:hypothetical protein ACFLZY_03500 [Patescibacteria group bacterium]